MEVFYTLLGLAMVVGQIFAIIVCFQSTPAKWMKICGGIGAILCLIGLFGATL